MLNETNHDAIKFFVLSQGYRRTTQFSFSSFPCTTAQCTHQICMRDFMWLIKESYSLVTNK